MKNIWHKIPESLPNKKKKDLIVLFYHSKGYGPTIDVAIATFFAHSKFTKKYPCEYTHWSYMKDILKFIPLPGLNPDLDDKKK